MPLDALAIITPKAGKEARVEELLAGLAANVQEHEPDVERYVPTKVVGREGTPEYVVIERYAFSPLAMANEAMLALRFPQANAQPGTRIRKP